MERRILPNLSYYAIGIGQQDCHDFYSHLRLQMLKTILPPLEVKCRVYRFGMNNLCFYHTCKSVCERINNTDTGLACFPVQKSQRFAKQDLILLLYVLVVLVLLTSFTNSSLDNHLKRVQNYLNMLRTPQKTTESVYPRLDLLERKMKLIFNFIDTPGFGDYVDSRYCRCPITKYVDHYGKVVYREELG